MRLRSINLWSVDADALCITTNGVVNAHGDGVMGRGVALQATKRYIGLARTLGQHLREHGNCVGILKLGPPALVAFPVKHDWRDPADLLLIARSAEQLVSLANERHWQSIVLPRPGCGNGQRTWAEVEPLLAPVLDDRFLVVNQ